MAGVFDWHINGLLQRVWREEVAPSPDRFRSFFEELDGSLTVPGEVIDGWHRALTFGQSDEEKSRFVEFRSAYNVNTPAVPQITIGMQEEPADKQPLGHAGFPREDGTRIKMMVVQVTVEIIVSTPHIDMTRSLHAFVRQTLMAHTVEFDRMGYSQMEYRGGADLSLLEQQMPGASRMPQIAHRSQQWSALEYPCWPKDTSTTAKPAKVYASDVEIDGVLGGVEPVIG